ncbi:Zinc finger protein [Abeliophyllum distichum]|uniref:Zinc finger protein n=1 Tax=Abeliophyllum distichum TaxID=126358 RepID=A0ABD1SVG2_9LAMI
MVGKNNGIDHSCRGSGHYLSACPKKKRCPVCGEGFVKWLEVEKKSMNRGRLFFFCSSNCGYFKWSDNNQSNCAYDVEESSGVSSVRPAAKDEIEELSCIFKIFARISEEEDVKISVNITIRKGKGSAEDKDNGKGKGKTN